MNFFSAAGMFSNQFKDNNSNEEKPKAQNVFETLAPVVSALAQQQQQTSTTRARPKETPKQEQAEVKSTTQNVLETLAPVVATMVAQQQNNTSKESAKDDKSTQPSMFETLGPMLNLLPNQEEKKDKIFEYLGPVIKVLSPKWGDVIVMVLQKLDVSKLLDFTKDEKELEKRVREEENILENKNA